MFDTISVQCPGCLTVAFVNSTADLPRPGDGGICQHCAAVNIYTRDGLRPISQQEIDFDPDLAETILLAQETIRQGRKWVQPVEEPEEQAIELRSGGGYRD